MSLQAEQGNRNFPSALSGNRRAQARHTYGACRGNDECGENVGISKPIGVDARELDQIVVVRGAHDLSAHSRAGEAAMASR
jgi:hypothetical protein